MSYYKKIKGYDVFVTVEKPYVYDNIVKDFIESKCYCAAFKFYKEPGIIIGEYLRSGKEMRWFGSEEQAREAAFKEVDKRIT